MMHLSSVEGEDGLSALRAVLLTYMKCGGAAIHFNISSPALLKEAQAHPERYQTLQVRVCGWNILFNQLTKEERMPISYAQKAFWNKIKTA